MSPTGRQTYYDPMLSDFATRNFDVEGMGFVADQIMGTVTVGKQSGLYYVYDKSGFMQLHDDLRAPRTAANKVTFSTSTDEFFCPNRALAGEIALEDLANEDRAIGLRRNTTLGITLGLRRMQEVRVAALATSSGNPSAIVQLSGADAWSAVNSAEVLGPVSSAHIGIWRVTGLKPTHCVIDYETLMCLKRNKYLLDMYRYTRGGQLTDEIVFQEVLQVPNVIVAGGLKSDAPKGAVAAASNIGTIWGPTCLFFVAQPGQGTMETTNYLQRFRWRNPELPIPYRGPDGNELTFSVQRTVYDGAGQAHVEVLETGYFQSEKVTGGELAYLIKPR